MRDLRNIASIFLSLYLLIGVECASAQSAHDMDLNTFEVRGLSSTIDWSVSAPNAVTCFSSDWQPSFFVTPDSLLNVRITGALYVDVSCNDNDFVGFVWGYLAPSNQDDPVKNDYFLFDWKKSSENAPSTYGGYYAHAGYCVSRVNGDIEASPTEIYKYFWAHQVSDVFHPLQEYYDEMYAWRYNKLHLFDLLYKENYMCVKIDGHVVFEQQGHFHPGAFGLYSFAQSLVNFYNVKVTDLSFIYTDSDQLYCEGMPVNFSVGVPAEPNYVCPYVASYDWDFGDGSAHAYNANVQHMYAESGSYTVKLTRTYFDGVTEELLYNVDILPSPTVLQQPDSVICNVGDDITFFVEAEYVTSYQWFEKKPNEEYWYEIQNDGYVSGVNTPCLKISNIPITYNDREYVCRLTGNCGQTRFSDYVSLNVLKAPMRVSLKMSNEHLCKGDTSLVRIEIAELSQMKTAHLVLNYTDSLINITNISANSLENLDIESSSPSSGVLVLDMHAYDSLQLQHGVVAAFSIKSVGNSTASISLVWQDSLSYFKNADQETLESIYYDQYVMHNIPMIPNWSDSIQICADTELELDTSLFTEYLWSTGATDSHIPIPNEGTYWVQLVDSNQCISTDSVYVTLLPKPIKPDIVTLQNDIICANEDSIVFEVVGGMGDYLSYTLASQKYYDTVSPPYVLSTLVAPEHDAVLSVRWHNKCGASIAEEQALSVLPLKTPWVSILSDHTVIMWGQEVEFNAKVQDGGDMPWFQWYLGDELKQEGFSDVFVTTQAGVHNIVKLIMTADKECLTQESDTAFYTVKISSSDEVFVPHIVADDAQYKDFQVIFNRSDIYRFSLCIFDLQGRLVFASQDPFAKWNGSGIVSKGSQNIFLYHVQYALNNKEDTLHTLKGKFLLKK